MLYYWLLQKDHKETEKEKTNERKENMSSPKWSFLSSLLPVAAETAI